MLESTLTVGLLQGLNGTHALNMKVGSVFAVVCMDACYMYVCRYVCMRVYMHVEAGGQLHIPCFLTDLELAKQARLSG